MMGSDYPSLNLPANLGRDLFGNVADTLRSADLTLGNLEGVLSEGGSCTKNPEKGRVYAFRTPPVFTRNLADAGFDFMNLANNHMNDFGAQGIRSTAWILSEHGIEYGGPEGKIGIFEVDSVSVAIACFATSPGADLIFDIPAAQRKIGRLAEDHAIVIVSFHGGGEGLGFLHTRDTFEYFLGQPRGNVVAFARAMVDSGADFVWGHGPHVPRAMEIYKHRLIAYSLGNFCTWGLNISDERGYAPILRVVMDSTGVFNHGKVISAQQSPGQVLFLDSLHAAASLITRLSASDFSGSAPIIADDGTISIRADEGDLP
ncbi:MAG: CapA family protein [candidate division WOR-3 bacterium]|nr:MAG: CapA family protein [candidate division WOR-3 bacterium]